MIANRNPSPPNLQITDDHPPTSKQDPLRPANPKVPTLTTYPIVVSPSQRPPIQKLPAASPQPIPTSLVITNSTTPNSHPFATQTQSAYQDLGKVLQLMKTLNQKWLADASTPIASEHSYRFPTTSKIEADVREQAIKDTNFENLVTLNVKASEQWATLKPQVDGAVEHAVYRMGRPGPKQLSPHALETERGRYDAAKFFATEPTVSDLHKGFAKKDRFSPLVKYLDDLYERLADYPEDTAQP